MGTRFGSLGEPARRPCALSIHLPLMQALNVLLRTADSSRSMHSASANSMKSTFHDALVVVGLAINKVAQCRDFSNHVGHAPAVHRRGRSLLVSQLQARAHNAGVVRLNTEDGRRRLDSFCTWWSREHVSHYSLDTCTQITGMRNKA